MPDKVASAGELITAARAYDKVPFRHQGRSRQGLDCIGLIVCAARDIGIDLPDRHDYARDPADDSLAHGMDEAMIPLVRPEPGAVALIRFANSVRHVALITPERMIHVWDLVGRVVEHGWHPWFQVRTARLYRIPGICPS